MDKKRILMIDDESTFGLTMKYCLEKLGGYEVDCSQSAVEGLQKIRSHTYDVIFLDVLMPKIEGREALEKIRQVCLTPVVILSAYVPPMMEVEILHRGAFAVLRKPAEVDQLVELIHKAAETKMAPPPF